MPNTNKNLQLIQVLRGIASLLVVLLHCSRNSTEILQQRFLGDVFLFGGAGVDIFFVLSGFIITYTNFKFIGKSDHFNFFIRRRVVRIYPTYWIIISLFLLLQVLLPSFYRTHFSFDFINIISTYLLLPGHVMVNGVSWTLSYELFFYLLFSLAFFIPQKKWSFYIAMLYAAIIILLPVMGYNFENDNSLLSLVTYPMNVEFFMGVLVGVLISKISNKIAMPLIITGSILFLMSAVFFNLNYYLVPNTFNRVILFGIPSFFIITGLVKYELNKKIKVHNIFLLLGEASYSLYLIHLPVLAASFKIFSKLNMTNNLFINCIIILIVCIICYASILFYKFVEKPIIARLNSLRRIKVANEI
ncbi:MAG: Acyltransferase 3 [Chitinophagaceae bacterium]|nr:Acyltransferase 3 [Chitinophagaceae bacterium]MDB5222742.1 Acyltransferase 3 [Chitinophagaceae bacterium]